MVHSKKTILREGKGAFGKEYMLAHISAGTECAGSGTRETKECWAACYVMRDGTQGSTRYKTLVEAESEFLRWTTPIIEVTA